MVGNGNVAIDVARMLVLDPDELAVTDTADHAVEALGAASVHEVIVLGRRGPAQAAFTTPELRELGELTRADIVVDPPTGARRASADWLESDAATRRQAQRRVLRDYAGASRRPGAPRRAALPGSPVEILGEGDDGPVTGVRVVQPHRGRRTAAAAVPTGEEEVIACGLVLRSIGYRGAPLAGIPFDERRGLIRNEGGRVPATTAAAARRVRRRLGQARPVGRDRHQQEGRRRHRRPHPRGPRGRHAERARRADAASRAEWLRRALPGPRHVGRAGRRSTRTRPRSASRRAARASSSSAVEHMHDAAGRRRRRAAALSAGAPLLRRSGAERLEPPRSPGPKLHA